MKPAAYLFQAALIGIWWLGLATNSQVFDAFQFDGIGETAFWSFFLPDLVLIAGFSILRAYFCFPWMEKIIIGAFGYATLYCVNASLLTASGVLPTTLMGIGLAFNLFVSHSEYFFRESKSRRFGVNILKTVFQIVAIWLITLAIVPGLLIKAFGVGDLIPPPYAMTIGWTLFTCFSLLGLTSAFFMVRDGCGTPLPLDQPCQLVLTGPYRFVRNPMAIAGLGQSMALALVFQNIPILVYTVVGGIVWNWVVRPLEENDLKNRFGSQFDDYREQVRCWVPRVTSMMGNHGVKAE